MSLVEQARQFPAIWKVFHTKYRSRNKFLNAVSRLDPPVLLTDQLIDCAMIPDHRNPGKERRPVVLSVVLFGICLISQLANLLISPESRDWNILMGDLWLPFGPFKQLTTVGSTLSVVCIFLALVANFRFMKSIISPATKAVQRVYYQVWLDLLGPEVSLPKHLPLFRTVWLWKFCLVMHWVGWLVACFTAVVMCAVLDYSLLISSPMTGLFLPVTMAWCVLYVNLCPRSPTFFIQTSCAFICETQYFGLSLKSQIRSIDFVLKCVALDQKHLRLIIRTLKSYSISIKELSHVRSQLSHILGIAIPSLAINITYWAYLALLFRSQPLLACMCYTCLVDLTGLLLIFSVASARLPSLHTRLMHKLCSTQARLA